MKSKAALSAVGLFAALIPATAQVVQQDGIVSFRPATLRQVDFTKAQPMRLPLAPSYTPDQAKSDIIKAFSAALPPQAAMPGSLSGSVGTGQKSPATLGRPQPARGDGNGPVAFGTSKLPFSTARADLSPGPTNEQYPYRAVGKLFFKEGTVDYTCSASLIKKGVVLTAAHCVTDFGKRRFFSSWTFAPGYRQGAAPFAVWEVAQTLVLNSYYTGTDKCHPQSPGVVCTNDVAILVLKPQHGRYPGERTGWLALGWDRAGFTPDQTVQVTQVGYPRCLDDGELMQRNDAQAVVSDEFANNSVMGSLMCGGSSGGPIIANFGISPVRSTPFGEGVVANQVVGVTSWGSSDDSVKQMGASPLLRTNVLLLVNSACQSFSAACSD